MKLKMNQVVLTFLHDSAAVEFHAAIHNEARVVLIYPGYRGEIESFEIIGAYHLVEDE
jgi:hypothetical protein